MSLLENLLYILEMGACLIGAFYFLNQTVEAVRERRDKKSRSKTTTRK